MGAVNAAAIARETGVGRGVACRQRAERLFWHSVGNQRLDAGQDKVGLGDRSRLVEAHHVHPCEALDGGQLLNEHVSTAEANDADRKGHARQEHETFRNHAADARDRTAQRVSEAFVGGHLADTSRAAVGSSAQVTRRRIRSRP